MFNRLNLTDYNLNDRMIRYNVMKDFMFSMTEELSTAQQTLLRKMNAESAAVVEDPDE